MEVFQHKKLQTKTFFWLTIKRDTVSSHFFLTAIKQMKTIDLSLFCKALISFGQFKSGVFMFFYVKDFLFKRHWRHLSC